MSAPKQLASDKLMKSLAARPPMSASDVAIMNGFLSGSMPTKPADRRGTNNPFDRYLRSAKSLMGRKWQQSPDRRASVARRRKLGGSSGLPDTIRHQYTEGERAVLTVVAGEVKRHGICDLPIDRIAAVAGVSRTTVQNAIRRAVFNGHVLVTPRPRRGHKNLTNLVAISSAEWKLWIKRGPSPVRSIGFKSVHPTKITDKTSYGRADDMNATRDRRAGRHGRNGLGEGAGGTDSGHAMYEGTS